MAVVDEITGMVRWYAAHVYGRHEGPGTLPFYCDRTKVGRFAIAPDALARGDDDALFQLFVLLSMYQSRRDVDIARIQRTMSARTVAQMVQPAKLAVLVEGSPCAQLRYADVFDAACSVRRDFARDRATCDDRPRTPCHVKDATMAIRRMGDMGKLPTAAWLRLRDDGGGLGAQLQRVTAGIDDATARADAMVAYLAGFYRVAVKLATMYVSALATPALAPGLTPWAPYLDASHLVVVDANVARVVDGLRRGGARTYGARAAWLRQISKRIDLRGVHASWPRYSARLVQQALYWFRSRSNRDALGVGCSDAACVRPLCPFHDP